MGFRLQAQISWKEQPKLLRVGCPPSSPHYQGLCCLARQASWAGWAFFTHDPLAHPHVFMHKSWGGSHEPRRRPRTGAGCRLGIPRGSRPAPTNCAGNSPPVHGKCLVEVGRENGVLRPLRTGLGSTFYFCALFGPQYRNYPPLKNKRPILGGFF